jgi:thioredoxin-like negative regulator of GroEL
MKVLYTKEDIDKLIKENGLALLYFGNEDCNVCNALKPKIEEMLEAYPKIKYAEIDVERSLQISADFNIFTIPVVLVFIEGKEIIREARYISIRDLTDKISRYYELFYNL